MDKSVIGLNILPCIWILSHEECCFKPFGRDVIEIRESEHRAQSQAESLRNALEEHSLELRVKAAYDAEAACQDRLSVAEAEMAELRAELDTSERFLFLLFFTCLLSLDDMCSLYFMY